MTELKIEQWPIERLIPYCRNPRKNDDAVPRMAGLIKEFGFKVPIVARSDGEVIDGHLCLKAARHLGLETVPVVLADDWTPAQVKAFRLAVNKSAEWAEWDEELLALEIEDLKLEDFDLELIGFEELSLDSEETEGLTDPDEVPEVQETPVSKLGDIWLLGNHRLMCGDSTNIDSIEKLLDGAFMRMVMTSPPYGVGKDYEEKGIEPWRKTIGGVINAIKGKALIICWNIVDLFSTGTQFTEPTGAYSIQMMNDAGYGMLYNRIWKKPGANFAGNNPYYTVTTKPAQDYEYLYAFAEKDVEKHLDHLKNYLFGEAKKAGISNDVIKSNGGPEFMCGHWFTNHQFALIDEKNYKLIQRYCSANGIDAFTLDYAEINSEYLKNTIFSHNLSDEDFSNWGMYGVWELNTVNERLGGHAAAFPVELPTRYIKLHSYEGDSVLDPFGGTGTTLISCEQLNRKCYMMELSPHYVDVIVRRWQDFTGREATLEASGKTFAQVKDERG